MLPFLKIIIPNRKKYINFSNPFNSRQWLKLLHPSERYGLTFHPNLDLPASQLGFSFKTNRLGFRGPCSQGGDNVLMGTSFAMGLSVDNGKNWYDQVLNSEQWLNIGMPVGPHNHKTAIEDLHTGPGKTLLYLYHPNVWKTATGFVRADKEGRNIFQLLGWKTDLTSAIKSYPEWIAKEVVKSSTGKALYTRWDGSPFYFNTRYNWFPESKGKAFVQQQIAILNAIFAKFERVIVIRTPIKEDSLPEAVRTPMLEQLNLQYDLYWEQLLVEATHSNIAFHTVSDKGFSKQHFLPFDTHWSAEGNRLFADSVRPILNKAGVTGII